MLSYQTNYLQIVFEYFGVFKNSHNEDERVSLQSWASILVSEFLLTNHYGWVISYKMFWYQLRKDVCSKFAVLLVIVNYVRISLFTFFKLAKRISIISIILT